MYVIGNKDFPDAKGSGDLFKKAPWHQAIKPSRGAADGAEYILLCLFSYRHWGGTVGLELGHHHMERVLF